MTRVFVYLVATIFFCFLTLKDLENERDGVDVVILCSMSFE